MSPTTRSVGRIGADPAAINTELTAAIEGDRTARWRALEACRDYLRLVVRRGVRSRSAAGPQTSDLVHNTLVDGWRDFSRFRGRTPGQLRAWLRAILIHISLNARRRPLEIPLGSAMDGEARSMATSPSQAAQKQATFEAVDAALGRISPRHRDVIHLRIWDELSFAQIGEKLEVSEDAARMLFGRALANLRESMRRGHDPR
jgi:RNA polymerase sigma-70 factor (ECF subfamily)